MYQFNFYAHVTVSIVTLLSGVFAIILAFAHRRKNKEFTKVNKIINKSFVISMYTQLVLGFAMYTKSWSVTPALENNAIDPGGSPQIRFWEIEHVAIMIFALLLVQIGYIFISKTKSPQKKYLLTFWYFGIPLCLMIFTMIMAVR